MIRQLKVKSPQSHQLVRWGLAGDKSIFRKSHNPPHYRSFLCRKPRVQILFQLSINAKCTVKDFLLLISCLSLSCKHASVEILSAGQLSQLILARPQLQPGRRLQLSKLTFGTRGCQTASWKKQTKKHDWGHPSYMTLDFKTRQENHSVGCIYFSFFSPSKLPVFREWHSGEGQNKTKQKRKSMGQEKSA